VALSPSATGGFDGAQAFEPVRKLVEIGPRPPGSEGIHRAQAYIVSRLKSFGCPVEEHDFHGPTPVGDIAMKNIIAKIPGTGSGMVLYTTHDDTVRIPDFVGADDGGSGTGAMLELARMFCTRKTKSALNTWIVFSTARKRRKTGPIRIVSSGRTATAPSAAARWSPAWRSAANANTSKR
jgi:glutaminyl-peptide cyclotransferase